eukprot:TRINITY_DN3955_c0_g1_i6.p1 TRINITY_DN3955_c0_g1~~TRINITY_DN3955_c0_g1_i6.p1  ORF type:complete len:358 (-),score=14.02 TRINITY_DN3955_c0_g1_i6:1231-2241(-)
MFPNEIKYGGEGQFRQAAVVTPVRKHNERNFKNNDLNRRNGVKRGEYMELNQLWKILTWQNRFRSMLVLAVSMVVFYGIWLWIEILGFNPIQSVLGILVLISLINFVCSLVTVRWAQKYGNWENSALACCVHSQMLYIGRLAAQFHDSFLNPESNKTSLFVLLSLWLLLFVQQMAGNIAVSLLLVPGVFVFPVVFLKVYDSRFGQEIQGNFANLPRWWYSAGMLCVMILNWPYSNIQTKCIMMSICLVLIRYQLRPDQALQIEHSFNQTLNPVVKTFVKFISGWLLETVAYAESEGIISPQKYSCYSLSERRQQGTILEFQDSTFSNKENIRNGYE